MRVMVTIHLRYELLSELIGVCGYLIVARVRAGRLGSLPKPESWQVSHGTIICDMSSYLDAVDISQLSVRWGALIRVCGYLIVARVRAGRQGSRPEPESAGLLS
ncbi:hypothetical protein Syun_027938 [Stephania yunnanensis]|uniref:Uncharacterized protein n=1 Tax=Stephania yunnanensis TaxID=152371 RepID=A0AAP0HQE1_9MAGN